jgi:predicted ribosomally synthesized peptide with SipW-like signal peptide
MLNKKIITSSMSIIAALSLMTGATFAFFTDSASSTGNTFTTGNADLQIAVDNPEGAESFGSSVVGPTFNSLFPGFSNQYFFWLKNNSSAAITLDAKADLSSLVTSGSPLASALLVRWTCDQDGDNSLGDETPTAEFSAQQWFDSGDTALVSLPQGVQRFCSMNTRIPSTANSDIAGQTVSFNADYNAAQFVPTPTP